MSRVGKILQAIVSYGIAIVSILVCAALLRFWVFDLFVIPSESMYPALKTGDKILVLKPTLGARIYNDWSSVRSVKPDVRRTKGFRHIERNDILVFNYPGYDDRLVFNFNSVFCKRCIALPGDTLYVTGSRFFIPGVDIPLGNLENQSAQQNTPAEHLPEGMMDGVLQPSGGDSSRWTMKDMGPIWIPRRYSTVALTPYNLPLYGPAIEYESGSLPTVSGDAIMHEGKAIDKYTFMTDYYFVAGDNSMLSIDSRYWGFVPREFVMGVASVVLYNHQKGGKGLGLSRILKRVN